MSPNHLHLPDRAMRHGLPAEAAALLSGLAILAGGAAIAPSIATAAPGSGHEGPVAAIAIVDLPGGAEAPSASHHRKHARSHAKPTPIRGPGGTAGPETTSPSTGTADSGTATNGPGGTATPDSRGGAVAA